MNKQKGISKKIVLIIIALIIVVAVGLSMSKKAIEIPTDWKTFEGRGFTMRYPETLGTNYITPTEWPPKAQLFAGNPNCTEGGSEIDASGETVKKEINGHPYCVAKKSEAAAGSMYTQYVYAFSKGENKAGVFTFTLRLVQCGNYNEPEKAACEAERATFDIDQIIDRIAQSIVTMSTSSTATQ
jgi:hypothetical protein